MADDSEMDYLQTFLEEATTALVIDTYETNKKVSDVAGEKKCLIEPGELLSADGSFYKKRFKIKLNVATEAIMTGFINEIIDGCKAYNRRAAGYTYPSVMCNINFVYTNKGWSKYGRWGHDVYLDVEWCTS